MNRINNNKEMFERARNGDKQVREQLIKNNMGLAESIAVKYIRNKEIDIETATQEAYEALIIAIDNYDADKYENKIAFTTYAYERINWQIINFMRDNRETLPYKMRQDDFALRTKIYNAIRELMEKLQRFPKSNDIAEYIGEDVKRIEKVLSVLNYYELDKTHIEDDNKEVDTKETIPDRNNLSEEQIIDKIIIKQAIKKLPTELREIIELKYFQGYYLKDIAVIMNISNRKLYGLETKALKMLYKELTGKEIDKPIKKRRYDKKDLEKRRELILELMKQGLKQIQIAEKLGLAENTVSRDKKIIMEKLKG